MFQFPAFAPEFIPVSGLQPDGLPHSGIRGSSRICQSPRLFAAYHALLRLQEPRHPPCALLYFLLPGLHYSQHPTTDTSAGKSADFALCSLQFSRFFFSTLPCRLFSGPSPPPPLREMGLSESLSRRQRFVHYVNDLFFALMTDFSIPFIRIFPWRMRGSNPRPPACKAGALSQLS